MDPSAPASRFSPRTVRASRTIAWLAVAALCAVVVSAYFARPVPPAVSVSLAAAALIAFRRPVDGLLILAAIAPVASAADVLAGAPYDSAALLEALVLAVLGAAALRAALRGAPLVITPFDAAAMAFMAIAAASCVAQLPVLLLRSGDYDALEALSEFLLRDYFARDETFVAVEGTAVLLEGTALAVLASRSVTGASAAARVLNMMVVGGAAASALNLHRLLEISLRRPPFLQSAWESLQTLRFNTQFSDLNAAGSYFAMIAILAACRANVRTWAGRLHLAALPLVVFALWTSGSRVALGAALLGVAAALAARTYGNLFRRIRFRIVLPAGVLVILAALVAVVFLLPSTRHGDFRYSVSTRVEMLGIGWRMLADRPIFGVGTSQFYALFPRYTSPELQRAFESSIGRPVPRENAHNQFVQIGAELGAVGFAAFLLVLVCAIRGSFGEPWRAAGLAALGGFIVTWLAGHPLLTALVAFPFWMMVGVVASAAPAAAMAQRRRLSAGLVVLAVLLALTMRWRWGLERREADLEGVTIGRSDWSQDESGTPFQLAEARSTSFVLRDLRAVRVPVRSAGGTPHRVRIYLDGRLASVVTAPPGRWTEVTLALPDGESLPRYRRLEFVVEGSAAEPRPLMVGQAAVPGS